MGRNNSSVQFDLKAHATDFVPDALAANTLRGLTHQQDEQLKGLDDEIPQLRVRSHALKQHGAEIAESGRLLQTFQAPIRKLAPEILGEVFIQYGMDAWNVPLKNHRGVRGWQACTSDFRLPLLLVCQRWKRIAIGTPALWTLLRIDFTPRISHNRVQMCHDNSGCLPWKVQLAKDIDAAEMRLLLNNFHRVQEIKGYISSLMQEFHHPIVMRLPLLKVVHVIGEGSSRVGEDDLHLQDVIQVSPIESLELKDC